MCGFLYTYNLYGNNHNVYDILFFFISLENKKNRKKPHVRFIDIYLYCCEAGDFLKTQQQQPEFRSKHKII